MKKSSLFAIMIMIWVIIIVPVAFWTQRSLDFWTTYLKGQEVEVPYWLSFAVTLVFNAVIVALNVITEVIRLFI